MEQSATLHRCLLQYGHAFIVPTAYTAMANGRSKIEERRARWLLMTHDRVDGDDLALTHEFLALMLGVRRPGVTVPLSLLERAGLIQVNRGVISVVDREGLRQSSDGAYGAPEAEFQRLFGYSLAGYIVSDFRPTSQLTRAAARINFAWARRMRRTSNKNSTAGSTRST
jgi:hypothetical protein